MKKSTSLVVVLALAIGVAVGIFAALFYVKGLPGKAKKPVVAVEKHPVPPPKVSPAVRYPLPPTEKQPAPGPGPKTGKTVAEKPLPPLADSDRALRESLSKNFPGENFAHLFFLDHFIQRFVLLVDNLPRPTLPTGRLPSRPAPGKFLALGEEGHQVINPENDRRYASFVRLVDGLDTKKVVAVYVHFYPLFQEAYRQLGYPHGYFNDRLIEVIDHLLATPDIHHPIALVQHVVNYKYADPALEKLSAGQKILLRMGPENEGKIKEKLREVRQALISRAVGG